MRPSPLPYTHYILRGLGDLQGHNFHTKFRENKSFGSDVGRDSPVTTQVVRKNVCNEQLLWSPFLFHKGFFFCQSRNCRLLKEDFGPRNWPALVSASTLFKVKTCKYMTVLDAHAVGRKVCVEGS